MINKSAMKKFVMELCAAKYRKMPSYKPTRVSASFFNRMESKLRAWITYEIETRPAKGMTIK